MKIKSMNDFVAWKKQDKNMIDLRMTYIDITGDLVSGVVLSQIIYWNMPTEDGQSRLRVKTKDGQRWMAKTADEWHKETRLTRHQITKALSHLEKMGLIESKVMRFNGSPTKHVKLNQVVLFGLMPEFEKTKVEKTEMESEKSGNGNLKKRDSKVKKAEMESEKNQHSITETHTETTTEIEEKKKVKKENYDSLFEEFWKTNWLGTSDKKLAKPKYNSILKAVKKSGVFHFEADKPPEKCSVDDAHNFILKMAVEYSEYRKALTAAGVFCPDLKRCVAWLNAARWQGESFTLKAARQKIQAESKKTAFSNKGSFAPGSNQGGSLEDDALNFIESGGSLLGSGWGA